MNTSQEKKIRKRLRKAYDLAASTDDRSDVECLIDACIDEVSTERERIAKRLKNKQNMYSMTEDEIEIYGLVALLIETGEI